MTNYFVDQYFMVSVGGIGTREDVEFALQDAIDAYNRDNPGVANLVIDF